MIAVVLSTRGFIFTEVQEALDRELTGLQNVVFRSWDKGIPEAQNILTEEALKVNPDYILFIEEDTVIPEGGLGKMMASEADISFIDYAVEGWSCSARDKQTNEILWAGLGCTLVKKEVFEKLEKPYFRTDKALSLNFYPEEKWIDTNPQKVYGGHDIWFYTQARKNGFNIVQIEGECRHLKLESLGQKGLNNGLHIIKDKPKITKQQEIGRG